MYHRLPQYTSTKPENDMVNWIENKSFAQWETFINEKIQSEKNSKKKAIMIKYWRYAFSLKNFIDGYLDKRKL